MATITLVVCDVCRDHEREAKTYKVTFDGRTASTDRCEEHGVAFAEVFAQAPARRESTGVRGRGRRTPVTTIEEIEALKARRAKGA